MPIFSANFASHTLHLPWCRHPFVQALAGMQAQGLPKEGVLWVLPRVALRAELEQAWLATYAQGGGVHQGKPHSGLWVQSADRLSQASALAPWYGLLAEVAALLQQQPSLGGHLPIEALWRLADEYLHLALHLVARRSASAQKAANDAPNPLAAMEVQCVQQIATLLEDPLLALLPPALPTPGPVQALVWFDDGDPWPGLWLAQHYPGVPCWRVVLPLAQGPGCWQEAAEHRAQGAWPLGLSLAIAPDETRQAQQAAHQVLQWLQAKPNEAVVVAVQDRLAARRVVAILAEHGVQVDDRTGWRLSTASVAAWLDGLLGTLVQEGQVQSLRHPLGAERLTLPQPWVLAGQHTVAGWAALLLQGLQGFGVVEALQNDAAGRLLLYSLRLCMATHSQALWPLAAWQAAWRFVAEGLRFRPSDTPSTVRLVPLLSTRLHGHARVLVLGCAQRHFQESPPGLLPPPVLAELGLVGPRLVRQQKLSALLELVHSAPQVHLLHAATVQGQAQRLLPELQWLHIVRTQLHQAPWLQPAPSTHYPVNPAPTLPLQLRMAKLPAALTIPVRAVEAWQACPLRFGLQYAMPWPIDPLPAPMAFAQCRGNFVHKVLEKTSQAMQAVAAPTENQWCSMLKTQMHSVWLGLPLEEQALILPFLSSFERLLQSLAACLQQRSDQGWRLQQQEGRVRGAVHLPALGQDVGLVGRVDRVEARAGQVCIVDVKTSNPAALRAQAKAPEAAPQLPLYQALQNAHQAELAYLAVHEKGVEWVPLAAWPGKLGEEISTVSSTESNAANSWGSWWMQRLQQEWGLFFDGHTVWQALPSTKVCAQCEVRALCRPPLALAADEEDAIDPTEPMDQEERA